MLRIVAPPGPLLLLPLLPPRIIAPPGTLLLPALFLYVKSIENFIIEKISKIDLHKKSSNIDFTTGKILLAMTLSEFGAA